MRTFISPLSLLAVVVVALTGAACDPANAQDRSPDAGPTRDAGPPVQHVFAADAGTLHLTPPTTPPMPGPTPVNPPGVIPNVPPANTPPGTPPGSPPSGPPRGPG